MNKKQPDGTDIAGFCRSLYLLYRSGVSLGDGLLFLAGENGEEKEWLEEMGRKIDEGTLLSLAVKESGRYPEYVSSMMHIGEQTGRLGEALEAVADYYEGQEKLKKQMKSTLSYPLVLFGIMLLIIGVLLIRVLPVFDQVYVSLGSGMTGLAGGLLKLGYILEAMLPVLGVIMLLLFCILLLFVLRPQMKEKTASFLRKRWGDTGVLRRQNDAHITGAISMGIRSGMTAEESVVLAGELMKDIPGAEKRCRECVMWLDAGKGLPEALRQTGIFAETAGRRLELGLRTGTADEVVRELAEQLSEEAREALERRAAAIEPMMVLITSLLVGMILLAVMLPLLDIMTALNRM